MKTNKRRILTLILTLTLVICVSVPAFAYGSYPASVSYPPTKGMWIISSSGSGTYYAFEVSAVTYIERGYDGAKWSFYDENGSLLKIPYYVWSKPNWQSSGTRSDTVTGTITWTNCTIVEQSALKWFLAEPIMIDRPEVPETWDYSEYKYGFMIHEPWNDTYFFYAYDVKATALGDPVIRLDSPTKGIKYEYDKSIYSWKSPTILELESGDTINFSSPFEVVWSSYDIYNTDGTLFFRGTPTLTMVLEPVEMSGVLAEIVTILPIGLACGIGYLALRKGLAILRQILSQA